MEKTVRGDQDDNSRHELNHPIPKKHAVSARSVVVEPPEGTEDAWKIPTVIALNESCFMEGHALAIRIDPEGIKLDSYPRKRLFVGAPIYAFNDPIRHI